MNGRVHLSTAIERLLADGRPHTHASILAVVGGLVPPENALWAFAAKSKSDRLYRGRPIERKKAISLDRRIRLGRARFVTQHLKYLGSRHLVHLTGTGWAWLGTLRRFQDRGVSFHKASHKWNAYLSRDGRRRSLGYFHTREAAVAARITAEYAEPNS